ncbi:hypothetical protein COLO4_02117 [Corchorus olitorius]|uniref:Uncharacterized protein n=1 Tax=Corchorus olitorius TaxID=93759 RepID=A0A1R3L1L5_9ROSI|nr:hypothetical protein COLO4_02117 [Corchorus olitorius]
MLSVVQHRGQAFLLQVVQIFVVEAKAGAKLGTL